MGSPGVVTSVIPSTTPKGPWRPIKMPNFPASASPTRCNFDEPVFGKLDYAGQPVKCSAASRISASNRSSKNQTLSQKKPRINQKNTKLKYPIDEHDLTPRHTKKKNKEVPCLKPTLSGSEDERAVEEVLRVHPHTHWRRFRTLARVRKAIQVQYGAKYEVELFGSVRYGIALPKSDLDMTIIDPDRPHGISPESDNNIPRIYDVRNLARTLHSAGFKNITPVPWARVPIVKFRDALSGLECDLNVNEQLGIFNSEMIKAYCSLSPDLRRMLAFIKMWSKPLGLNTPSPQRGGGPASFSSYAFALMTIGFLQERGLLPNLQAKLPQRSEGAMERYFWLGKQGELWDARFQIDAEWKTPEKLPLRDLMVQWFKFWRYDFGRRQKALCIRRGGLINRVHPSFGICVMDPFIRTKNVTKNIHNDALARFLQECEHGYRILHSGQGLSGLIGSSQTRKDVRLNPNKKRSVEVPGLVRLLESLSSK